MTEQTEQTEQTGHAIMAADVHRASGTLASLMAAAKAADDMQEGRLREDFITLARIILHDVGALGIGTRELEMANELV